VKGRLAEQKVTRTEQGIRTALAPLGGWDHYCRTSFHPAKRDLGEVGTRKADIQDRERHRDKLQV